LFFSLNKIPQFRNLIQQILQIDITNLIHQARNQRLRLLCTLTAQTPQLTSFKQFQLEVAREHLFDGGDGFGLFEAREDVEVVLGFD